LLDRGAEEETKEVVSMQISKRFALALSGAAFAGAAALTLGAASPASAAVSAPASVPAAGVAQSLVFCGGGGCGGWGGWCDCWCDDWDDCD
jgi:hypothetical protein